jgi:hypothetical protein
MLATLSCQAVEEPIPAIVVRVAVPQRLARDRERHPRICREPERVRQENFFASHLVLAPTYKLPC